MPDHPADPKRLSPDDFRIGEVVFEKYKIVRFINSGGNGRVYRATDIFRNVDVALKTMIFDEADTKALIRFQSEARTASKFKHPNIATIYDFGFSGSTPYLSMEYIEGESLAERLSGNDTLDLENFCEIFFQLAIAIQHAHKHSIVHRDLKPQNVMISENADGSLQVKILDFGVAKTLGEIDIEAAKLTTTGGVIGSPLYMSPEQASGREVTTQSDLYSLGAMMFRSLTGRPPLRAASSIETIMLVASTSPPKIQTIKETVPTEIANLVDGLLEKEPAARPDISEVVIPTLKAVADGLGTKLETPEEITRRAGGKSFNRKYAAIISGVLAITFLSASISIYWLLKNPKLFDTKQLELEVINDDETVKPINAIVDRLPPVKESSVKNLHLKVEDFKAPHSDVINWENTNADDKSLFLIPQPETVTELRLNKTKVETLKALPRFENLKRLYLGETNISNHSLKNITELPLETLDLEDTKVSDEGLKEIAKLRAINFLILSTSEVTASGFKYLKPLNYLRNLYIGELTINPADLRSNALNFAPNCSVWFNHINQDEVEKLRDEFPDLNFNETYGAIASQRKEAESLAERTKRGDLIEAADKFREIVTILERVYGSGTPRLRRPVLSLASVKMRFEKPNWTEVETDLLRSIKLSQAAADAECEHDGLQLLTMAYLQELDCKRASFTVNKSLDLAERIEVKNPDKILEEYDRWSRSILQTTCVDRAQQIADRGLKFGQRMKNPNIETLASLLQTRGNVAKHNKRYDEAIAFFRKSAESLDTLKPFNNAQSITQISNYAFLADCEGQRNDNERAYKYTEKARALCRSGIPSDTQVLVYTQALHYGDLINCSEEERSTVQERLEKLKGSNSKR